MEKELERNRGEEDREILSVKVIPELVGAARSGEMSRDPISGAREETEPPQRGAERSEPYRDSRVRGAHTWPVRARERRE